MPINVKDLERKLLAKERQERPRPFSFLADLRTEVATSQVFAEQSRREAEREAAPLKTLEATRLLVGAVYELSQKMEESDRKLRRQNGWLLLLTVVLVVLTAALFLLTLG